MVLTIKDVIYLIIYIVSIAGVYFAFKNRLSNVENEIKRNRGIMFQDGGRLNVVDHKGCREYRDAIWASMRKCDSVVEGMSVQLITMGNNIVKIMTMLKIKEEKENGKKEG